MNPFQLARAAAIGRIASHYVDRCSITVKAAAEQAAKDVDELILLAMSQADKAKS